MGHATSLIFWMALQIYRVGDRFDQFLFSWTEQADGCIDSLWKGFPKAVMVNPGDLHEHDSVSGSLERIPECL